MAKTTRLNKVTLAQVKQALAKRKQWNGYLAPSLVAETHVASGWCLGCHVSVTSEADLARLVDEFRYHNCNAELGQDVAYWEVR